MTARLAATLLSVLLVLLLASAAAGLSYLAARVAAPNTDGLSLTIFAGGAVTRAGGRTRSC